VAQAREIVERELGRPVEEVFATWEEEPFSAASIGQVHRATLHDGRRVAVKVFPPPLLKHVIVPVSCVLHPLSPLATTQVMYPGIESMFRHDLATLKRFCALAQPQHLPALDEIERQFLTEFDYRKEADNLRTVRANILPKWGRRVAIPEPVDGLCTEHVLVMVSSSGFGKPSPRKQTQGVRKTGS
jgi:aarF domain-containing kinase